MVPSKRESISVSCKREDVQGSLYSFLTTHLRPFSEVCDLPEHEDVRATFEATRAHPERPVIPLPSAKEAGLAGDPTCHVWKGRDGPSKIGFTFPKWSQYDIFLRSVMAWAALQAGKRKGRNALSVVGKEFQRVPYYTYRGVPTPVLLPSHMLEWPDNAREYGKTHWEVTALGVRVTDKPRSYISPARSAALRAITEREMRRLDALWDDWCAAGKKKVRKDPEVFCRTGEKYANETGIIRELVKVEGRTNHKGERQSAKKWVVHWKGVGGQRAWSGSCKWASWIKWAKEVWEPRPPESRPDQFPVPNFDDSCLMFRFVKHRPPWHWVPKEFKRHNDPESHHDNEHNPWCKVTSLLVMNNRSEDDWHATPRKDIDAKGARKAISETREDPSIGVEVRIATTAYMMSQWFEDCWFTGDRFTRINKIKLSEWLKDKEER